MQIDLKFTTRELNIIQNGLRVAAIHCKSNTDSQIYEAHAFVIQKFLKSQHIIPTKDLSNLKKN